MRVRVRGNLPWRGKVSWVESRDSGDLSLRESRFRILRLFSRLSSNSSFSREEKVYRADDCAAPLLVASVDVGQVMMNDSDDRCLVVVRTLSPRE